MNELWQEYGGRILIVALWFFTAFLGDMATHRKGGDQ